MHKRNNQMRLIGWSYDMHVYSDLPPKRNGKIIVKRRSLDDAREQIRSKAYLD